MMTVLSAADQQAMKQWTVFFNANDAEQTADKNHKTGKLFIFGAMGAGAYYPGLDAAKAEVMTKTHKVVWIPETSDAISGKDHMKYIRLAESWAEKYNQRTLKLIAP